MTNRLTGETLDIPQEEAAEIVSARPSGINIGAHTVTQATEHLPEKHRDLVRWLHASAKARRLTWKELSAEVGLSTSTLSRIFTDQYRHPKDFVERDKEGNVLGRTPNPKGGQRIALDTICEDIARYRQRMEKTGKAENPEFVTTSVYERIEWLFGRVQKNHRMAFIYGDGQVGKSTCLREVTRRNNGGRTTYCEMPPASGVQFMLKKVAQALQVPALKSFDALLDDVMEALDSSKVLIIDEIHRVFTTYQKTSVMRCLDTLRYIHDQTGCGLILCGTNVFRDAIKEGEFKKYLTQFHRRGRSYELQLPTIAPWPDVLAIAAWFGLDEPTREAKPIVEHVNQADGIGVLRMRLVDAADLAKNKGEKLNWGHFVRAYGITERAAR